MGDGIFSLPLRGSPPSTLQREFRYGCRLLYLRRDFRLYMFPRRHISLSWIPRALLVCALAFASVARAVDNGTYTGYQGIVTSWTATHDYQGSGQVRLTWWVTGTIIVAFDAKDKDGVSFWNRAGVINANQTGLFTWDINVSQLPVTVGFAAQGPDGNYGPWLEGIIYPADPKKVVVNYTNNQSYEVKIKMVNGENGAPIPGYEALVTVAPYSSMVPQTVTLPDGVNSVQVMVQITGVSLDGPVWQAAGPETVTEIPAGPPITGQTGTGTQVTAPEPKGLPGAFYDPSVQSPLSAQYGPTVWSPPTAATAAADVLDKQTFKEGVGKVETALGKISSGGSGGGTSIDLSGVLTKLETANEYSKTIDDKAKADKEAFDSETDQNDETFFQSKADAMATSAIARWNQAVADENLNSLMPVTNGAAQGAVGAGGAGDWPVIDFPVLGVIEFNPYVKIPWIIPYLNSAREVALWFLCIAFCKFGMERCNEYIMGAARTPGVVTSMGAQDGVPIIGQLISWLKQRITVGVVMVVLVGAYGSGVLLLNTHIADFFPTVKGLVQGASPAVSLAGSQSFWNFIQEAVPVKAIFQLAAAEVVLLFGMGVFFAGASSVVRSVRV